MARTSKYDVKPVAEIHPQSKYEARFAKIAGAMCKLGATDGAVAAALGFTEQTLIVWRNKHPALRAAMERGREEADNAVVKSLYQRATGYDHKAVKVFLRKDDREPVYAPYVEHAPPDVTACIFWLKNRQRVLWRDVNRTEHTGADGKDLVVAPDDMEIAKRLAFILAQADARQAVVPGIVPPESDEPRAAASGVRKGVH